jgi:hypothetical protein
MTTIWKFPIEITDRQELNMPGEAKILSVGLDPSGVPCVWAMVQPGKTERRFHVHIVGTGNPAESAVGQRFVGSFVQGPFVWHVFTD